MCGRGVATWTVMTKEEEMGTRKREKGKFKAKTLVVMK